MHQVNAQIGQQLYQTTLTAGNNTLLADEPVAQGGQDSGFSPMELLCASLASCTAITLKMYAQRKEWAVDSFQVQVNMQQDSDTKTTTFTRSISYQGTLDEAQLKRVEAIANACPVHKLLHNSIQVVTNIELA